MITTLNKLDETFIKKYVKFIIKISINATTIGKPEVFEAVFGELLEIYNYNNKNAKISNIDKFVVKHSNVYLEFGIDLGILGNYLNGEFSNEIKINKNQIKIILVLTTMPPKLIKDLVDEIDEIDKMFKGKLKEAELSSKLLLFGESKLSNRLYLYQYKTKHNNFYMDKTYKNFRNDDLADEYVKSLDLYMCPYCNCDDIAIKDEKNEFKSKYQLDHFHDKSKYYYFAVSIYNLIPSCQKCNHIKSTNTLKNNPYLESPTTKFSISIDNIIVIETTNDNSDDIKTLEIEARYNTEYSVVKNEIVELKNIVNKYNKSYFELSSFMGLLEYEIVYWKKKALRDGLIEERNFNKARLSKVKSDIVKTGIGEDEYNRLMGNNIL